MQKLKRKKEKKRKRFWVGDMARGENATSAKEKRRGYKEMRNDV